MREKEVSCIKPVEETPLRNEEHAQVRENDVLEKRSHSSILSIMYQGETSISPQISTRGFTTK